MFDYWPFTVLVVGLILGASIEAGKLVFRILIALLVRPKDTPRWPWTTIH